MTNEEILKKRIGDSILIKLNEGEDSDCICGFLANQLYMFIIEDPNLKFENISRGIRGILTEKNKVAIKETVFNMYCNYINENNGFKDPYDNYVKDILEMKGDLSKLRHTIFSNDGMIYRMGEAIVEDSLRELEEKQTINGSYIQKTAQKSTPENNATTITTLATAQRATDELLKIYGYDELYGIEELENEIIIGPEKKPKNRLYEGNGMSGILNIGTKLGKDKKVQEDSILMMAHPDNENFRIALVADGIGGEDSGDRASYIAMAKTKEWFENLSSRFYSSDVIRLKYKNGDTLDITFEEAIKQHLVDINDEIIKQLGPLSGTTFSAAITRNKNGKETVTSVSIGDSKISKISPSGEITQLSKDDHPLAEAMKNGALYVEDSNPNIIVTSNLNYASEFIYKPIQDNEGIHVLNENDMRFYRKNNIITGYLGSGQKGEVLRQKLDKNTSDFITEHPLNMGDRLFLCSDGVSDTLTNEEISSLMSIYRNPRDCLINIVNELYEREKEKTQHGHNNPPIYLRNNKQFKNHLKGNEDNISAIIVDTKGDER